MYAEVAKIYVEDASSIHEIMKEKEICAIFAVTALTSKAMDTVYDKCLVKMEKALDLYNKIF